MKIGIIGPTEVEIDSFIDSLSSINIGFIYHFKNQIYE